MLFQIIASTPVGFPGTTLARAAHRAGFLGAVALEYCSPEQVRSVLESLSKSDSEFCFSIETLHPFLLPLLERAAASGLKQVILSEPLRETLKIDIAVLRACGIQALVQIISLQEATLAQKSGADGLIVKGNESAGLVGEETVFVLLQRILPAVSIPVFARGGIGLHTAAACIAAGAAGAVLDWQLALCEESEIADAVKARIARMDGSETAILGQDCSLRYRAYARPGESVYFKLKGLEEQLGLHSDADAPLLASWKQAVESRVSENRLLLVGQDACFARDLAQEFRTVGAMCRAIQREAQRQCRVAAGLGVLGENGPLAQSHGTQYPIAQGPMTRVSDRADFALEVATAGGLPFLALALMRGAEVAALLEETKRKLAAKPWGIGILGFVPVELREEQLAEVLKYKPPFALIAGGRPDQAKALEREGIPTYLHVPSPELLRNFLDAGTRRVVFEGRECGGHVGPRTSFVLWESMIRVILAHLQSTGNRAEDYHVLFAGGIHDALSSAMVSAMAAPLSERGVRIGALVGTAYLFTFEAVSSGAIMPGFQQEAVECSQTILLESGVGHATRCADTAFGKAFLTAKRQLIAEGRSKEDIREALERLNLGRLRVAAKGIVRNDSERGERPVYQNIETEEQRLQGMYMIGQVAALRNDVCTVRELHADIGSAKNVLNKRLETGRAAALAGQPERRDGGTDIAIIGLSCVLPKANDLDSYWRNILNKTNAITEIPKERWDADLYFDGDRQARDKIYSRWGGFLDPIPFDPTRYGMPPTSLPSVEPLQLLMLEMVRAALDNAGYTDRRFDRERTSVILGTGGGVGELGLGYGFRSLLPHYLSESGGTKEQVDTLIEQLSGELPSWTEDSFAGLLLNVAAGRVANRFDLGGTNYIVDAACATSLAALRLAANELECRSSDMVIVAGADTMQSPFGYLCFSKTQALSPTGQCRTFDETADGIVISEGVVVAILKRLDDAVRDGDSIYAVLKSVGASSDGKDKGLTAPRPIGQIRALDRAYLKAGFPAETVGLIEAHGTGTVVGDRTEVESLMTYFKAAGAATQSCALGSVKSMIGHTKCTAGFAGLVKAAMALRHKVLPPTIGVTKPTSKTDSSESPLYVNTETRPWMNRLDGAPRRAGVSAFGFGGTNFHAVLEEYQSPDNCGADTAPVRVWPAELFLWRGENEQQILERVDAVSSALSQGAKPSLCDLAAVVYWEQGRQKGSCCLAVVATSLEDLTGKLQSARSAIASGKPFRDPKGIYYSSGSAAEPGKIAFLFPGQGSQRVGMLLDLALAVPLVRDTFEEADQSLGNQLNQPLSRFIFPPPVFSEENQTRNEVALKQTDVAQPALGAADIAMYRLLVSLGIEPDMVAGHSYGEFAALCAAGSISLDELIRISEARGRFINQCAHSEPGTMAAVDAGEATVAEVIAGLPGVCIANLNSPSQTVISGTRLAVEQALKGLSTKGATGRMIPVACAFHSDLVAGARQPLRDALDQCTIEPPRIPVFSNTTGTPHTVDPDRIREDLADHIVRPVRFTDEILAMYEAGARTFIESGPGKVLTGLAATTLSGRPVSCVSLDQSGRNGLQALVHGLAQLATAGVPFFAYKLFEGRVSKTLTLAKLVEQTRPAPLKATTWMITDGRAVPPGGRVKSQRTASVASAFVAANSSVAGTSMVTSPAAQQQSSPVNGQAFGNTGYRPAAAASVPVQQANGSATPANASDASDALMRGHRQLMSKFLDTHRNIMLTSLGASYQNPVSINHTPVQQATAPVAVAIPSVSAQPPADTLVLNAPVLNTAGLNTRSTNGSATAVTPLSLEPATVIAATNGHPAKSITKEEIAGRLIELVGHRTGYPAEMLELNLDLEADLGIDSIKRIEIFGALQTVSLLDAESLEGEIEALSKLKTLQAIVDWIAGRGRQTEIAVIREPVVLHAVTVTSPQPAKVALPRLTVQAVDAPASELPAGLREHGLVLITDDGTGIATLVAQRLGTAGIASHLLEFGSALLDPAAAATLIQSIQEGRGPITALLHLLPLAGQAGTQGSEFDHRLARELKSLFHLTKALDGELRSSKNARVIAATRMGGLFATGPSFPAGFWPGSGAVSGFVKTLAWEWPDAHCKTVDFGLETAKEQIAAALVAELSISDKLPEIGYYNGTRKTLVSVETPLKAAESNMRLDSDSVVIVTGGARGITADVALELAQKFRPKLVLVGRSPAGQDESADTAHLSDAKELKRALIEKLRSTGQSPSPAVVEREFIRIQRSREIQSNILAMKQAGAAVEYHSIDVADDSAFTVLIEDVYNRLGRIDGVIHGAGVIEDKLLRDKSPESFDRVLQPKISAALTLARELKPESLKFMAFFSSVSARYGNRGQSDYAAANEVLNKLAVQLNGKWPGRIVSINWGPWSSEGGMVSSELASQFEKLGVHLVSPPEGCAAFVNELLHGAKTDAEVIWGGPIPQKLVYPLLEDSSKVERRTNGSLEILLETRPDEHIYLLDHQIDSRPVMPMAMVLELVAETAAAKWPGWHVSHVRGLQMLHGITYEPNGNRIIRIEAHSKHAEQGGSVQVHFDVKSGLGTPQIHYRCDVELRPQSIESPSAPRLHLVNKRPLRFSVAEANRQWLFHGPRFTGVLNVEGLGHNGIIGQLRASSTQDMFQPARPGRWITDPVMVDSALQLLIFWARTYLDQTPLPSRLGCYHAFGVAPTGSVRCEAEIHHQTGSPILRGNLRFLDANHRLIGWLEDMEVTCSPALNRLSLAKAAGEL